MARCEKCFQGEFGQVLEYLVRGIRKGSGTAALEGGSDLCCGGARVSARACTRFSFAGQNRVGLTPVLAGAGRGLPLSAITSGGNGSWGKSVWGRESFLGRLLTDCGGVGL